MDYFTQKAKHAYECYISGKARQKVYGVVEKGDKFVVLKGRPNDKYKYSLSGGGIEDDEDFKIAIEREVLEEMNMKVEFVKKLGFFQTKSKWKYNDEEFWVNDDIYIVYTKFIAYGTNKTLGIEGEFEIQDVVVEVTKDEMIDNVVEFVKFGIKL